MSDGWQITGWVVWSRQAARDVARIRAYIGRHNPFAAQRGTSEIVRAALRLEDFPDIGRLRSDGLRELMVTGRPYIVQYHVLEDRVEVVAVWHGAQDRGRSRDFSGG